MITLTNTHQSILGAFVNPKFKEKNEEMSSGDLKKEGINRRTFEINQEFLLSNGLVKIHSRKKHGTQVWIYYQITKIGLLVLLKSLAASKNTKKLEEYLIHFPQIKIHANDIRRIFGSKVFEETMIAALDNFELKIQATKNQKSQFQAGLKLQFKHVDSTYKEQYDSDDDERMQEMLRRFEFLFYHGLFYPHNLSDFSDDIKPIQTDERLSELDSPRSEFRKKKELAQIIQRDQNLYSAMMKYYEIILEQTPKLDEIKESISLLKK